MSVSLEACRNYVPEEVVNSLKHFQVEQFHGKIVHEVSDLCVEMGIVFVDYSPENPERFNLLRKNVAKCIYEISADPQEQARIFAYANRIMTVARDKRIAQKLQSM